VGETFAGVDFATGVAAARELGALVPPGASQAQLALRWILDRDAVSTVIPGARSPEQARGNAAAAALPPLSAVATGQIRAVYDERIRPQVHGRW
jgi:aryl-alcohol dehydrogenase-like predicted oxidoreductase